MLALILTISICIFLRGSTCSYINLGSEGIVFGAPNCPVDIPLTCTNSTPIDNSCCFESPGGILLLTQFWDYYPPIGGNESFTLHGLWPDNCDGTYEQFCDDSLNIRSATDIVLNQFGDKVLYGKMSEFWKNFNGNDESLWIHEFNKHATCVKTIRPTCYDNQRYVKNKNVYDFYNITMNLYEKLPTFQFLAAEGIVPSLTQKYSKKQINDALTKYFGKAVYFKCNKYKALQEVWYYHYLQGPLKEENFSPIDTIINSNCPEENIQFIPKNGFNPGPQPPKSPRKGYLESPGKKGCLISNGLWYEAGTCATYAISQQEFGGYKIRSSKGYCGMNSQGQFTCNKQVDPTKNQFQYNKDTRKIGYGGNFAWCLDTEHKHGDGKTAQTPIKISDGQCDSFPVQYGGK